MWIIPGEEKYYRKKGENQEASTRGVGLGERDRDEKRRRSMKRRRGYRADKEARDWLGECLALFGHPTRAIISIQLSAQGGNQPA
jgi:hypothetical protein